MQTFNDIKQELADHGIYQLRKGESVKDALDYIHGKRPFRVGYQIKADNCRVLSKNEVIAASNKEAFSKSVTIPDYEPFDLATKVEEITGVDDYREDTSKPGVLEPCMYCGKALRIDRETQYDILNCEECMGVAILKNCL